MTAAFVDSNVRRGIQAGTRPRHYIQLVCTSSYSRGDGSPQNIFIALGLMEWTFEQDDLTS